MPVTTEEICALVRKTEREARIVRWTALVLVPLFAVAFLHNLATLHNPWIIAGTAWALTAFCYVWELVWRGPNPMQPEEPCVGFLRREFAGKRRGLLRIQRGLLLLIPAIVSCWWGGGPYLRAKSLGVQSPRWLGLYSGPVPLIALGLIIAFCSFSFWMQVRKVDNEIEMLDVLASPPR